LLKKLRKEVFILKRLFTSESVGPGHPDKICDQISDAILDECLRRDRNAYVACECFITRQFLVIGGEITGNIGEIDYEGIARTVIKNIGYHDEESGINPDTCQIIVKIQEQSADIALGVKLENDEIGAGDQGSMYGFAVAETPTYMPLPIYLAHELMKITDDKRRSGEFKWALPDMKGQITVDYEDYDNPKIHTILLSCQHQPLDSEQFQAFKNYIKNVIIKELVEKNHLEGDYRVLINPTGRFVIGGPAADTGLTGRKIIVDTYGGYSRHGGGSFSGKDPTKVDRSAAYMARYIAKNLVAAGAAKKLEIQLSYSIGISEPISVSFKTFKTAKVSDEIISEAIDKFFKLTPKGIIESLDLRRPIYQKTATFGHMGREDLDLPWERLDKVSALKSFFKEAKKNNKFINKTT
jgi:S-adenosylmethionine synthetase